MRALVTGGAGFIGSHLAEALLARGDRVHVLDDLSTGAEANVSHLRARPGFACTIGSSANAALVGELVAEADTVFHLAAAVGVDLVVASPLRAIGTNVRCTEVVLEAARRRRTPVLLASTSEVYGRSTRLPFREDGELAIGPPSRGRWAYACSKALAESLALAHHREHGLPVTVARLFNTAGPRQTGSYGMVVPRFVRAALAGEDVRVFGDGRQTRCFAHVADVVGALLALADADAGAAGEVFNVGSREEVAIRALAERAVAMAGSASRIVTVPYDDAYAEGFEETARRVPDTTKIEAAVGWRPVRTLDAILRDVVAHER